MQQIVELFQNNILYLENTGTEKQKATDINIIIYSKNVNNKKDHSNFISKENLMGVEYENVSESVTKITIQI